MSDENANDEGEKAPDGKTFTQDELDRIVGERVGRERTKFADYDDLKTKASEFDKMAEARKTEQQRLEERAATAEQKAQQAEQRLTRISVALTKKLPAELADRLQGSTQEELEADAERLLELVRPAASGFGDADARRGDVPPDDINAVIFGRR